MLHVCLQYPLQLDRNSAKKTGDYGPVSIWTAAEPSIAVISACLPSLRPLFARMIRRRDKKSSFVLHSPSRGRQFSPPWRTTGIKEIGREGSFDRLRDFEQKAPVQHNVAVSGGHEVDFVDGELGANRLEPPIKGIRALTTVVVTIAERVDWQDDLY